MGVSLRTAVLLGAGASADAGLPLTSELAEFVVAAANNASQSRFGRPDWVRAINATYSAMIGFKGSRGGNPLEAVNIETLISAIRLLQHRDEHEVAPFVASWSAALNDFGSTEEFARLGRSIQSAMLAGVAGHSSGDPQRVAEDVARIARAAIRPDLRAPFAEAEQFILRTLTERLGQLKSTDYLLPLIDLAGEQEGGLDIITLNYDLAVEAAADARGVTFNRGVEFWHPGSPLDFDAREKEINLVKLHGSLDWRLMPQRTLRDSPGIELDDRSRATPPWIVVGDREKLATEGPTLELNFAARRVLSRSDHLVVIGYSFGDAHVNGVIRDWMNHDVTRTITVLDYDWAKRRSGDVEDFRESLLRAYGRRSRSNVSRTIRLAALQGAAATHLATALTVQPREAPEQLFNIWAERSSNGVELDVTLQDLDLDDVTIELRDTGPTRGGFADTVEITARPPWAEHEGVSRLFNRLGFPRWPSGVTISLLGLTSSASLILSIKGVAPVGFQHVEVMLSLSPDLSSRAE